MFYALRDLVPSWLVFMNNAGLGTNQAKEKEFDYLPKNSTFSRICLGYWPA